MQENKQSYKSCEKHYRNRSTGEVSEHYADAMNWYRAGAEVEIWRNGKIVLVWEM